MSKIPKLFVVMMALALLVQGVSWAADQVELKTENIIFVMVDGLRWQEVFTGAEEALLDPRGKLDANDRLRQAYWRPTPEARREALMPFLWQVIVKEGQLFGNKDKGSIAQLTNGLNFSCPCYSELFSGFVDPKINSNAKIPNPNINVLEWLHNKEAYHGKVAAFAAWDLFPYILNRDRSGLLVNAGYEPLTEVPLTPVLESLNRMKNEVIRRWQGEPFDVLTFETAYEYFKVHQPKVFYLSFGETDEWGHADRYDLYLEAALHADNALKIIWETAQSLPQYKDKTTLIFCCDHGRGNGRIEWRSHGEDIRGSEDIFLAFMGPDTEALGERTDCDPVSLNRIAATLAALLGEDYCADVPQAGKAIEDVIGIK